MGARCAMIVGLAAACVHARADAGRSVAEAPVSAALDDETEAWTAPAPPGLEPAPIVLPTQYIVSPLRKSPAP